MKYTLLSIIFILVASSALAQTSGPCASQRNTMEMNECGKLTLAKADKELNFAFQKLLKNLSPADQSDTTNYAEVKKHLVEAQRNWVKFRDSDCKAQLVFNESGTIRGVAYLGCLIEHTEQRTKGLLQWERG